jgi:hypothetical protein
LVLVTPHSTICEAEEARSSANVSLASQARLPLVAHRDELGRFVFQGFGNLVLIFSSFVVSLPGAIARSIPVLPPQHQVFDFCRTFRLVDARMTGLGLVHWDVVQLPVSTPGPVWSIVGRTRLTLSLQESRL